MKHLLCAQEASYFTWNGSGSWLALADWLPKHQSRISLMFANTALKAGQGSI